MKKLSRTYYNVAELVLRPVVRKYLESEWMSKMTSKEFGAWQHAKLEIMQMLGTPRHNWEQELQKQIQSQELQYSLHKAKYKQICTQDIVTAPGCRNAVLTGKTATWIGNQRIHRIPITLKQ